MRSLQGDRKIQSNSIVLDLSVEESGFKFASSIDSALTTAELELLELEEKHTENTETINKLTSECDKTDYILATTIGVLSGVIDIFLVGKPGKSPVGDITDKWFEDRTKDFAKLCGWDAKDKATLSSAIKYLEMKFKIPYDQRGAGDAAGIIFDLNPRNHHFKSLAHNPTLLGLFFSILDQFNNTSHFVSAGELISLEEADGKFALRWHTVSSKLFCAFVNWFGHLISDISGSSSSKGRGMGIPAPFWSWTNNIIAIKRQLRIPTLEFDASINELALKMYKEGYDSRFQAAQAIPVFVNEMLVRLIYSVRRLVRYFADTNIEKRTFALLWKSCEPFSNATVKRMLTVAHGTFCLVDAGDAIIRGFVNGGGNFNVVESLMRLNIVGVGRFTISLYGETKRHIKKAVVQERIHSIRREGTLVKDYISGLKFLAEIYEDSLLLTFVDDLEQSDLYKQAFKKTILLAEKRKVSEDKILKSKADIDNYFRGENFYEK